MDEELFWIIERDNKKLRKSLLKLGNRQDKAIRFCAYLLSNEKVIINGKEYIKQNGDDIITKAIKDILTGDDE